MVFARQRKLLISVQQKLQQKEHFQKTIRRFRIRVQKKQKGMLSCSQNFTNSSLNFKMTLFVLGTIENTEK